MDRGAGHGRPAVSASDIRIVLESPVTLAGTEALRGQVAAQSRARQAFGADPFGLLTGMGDIDRLFDFHLATGNTAVGVAYRPWKSSERNRHGAMWAYETTYDDDVRLMVDYRLAGEESTVPIRLDRLWRLASAPGVEILSVRTEEIPAWFVAASDVVAGETRYRATVEDARGIGAALWTRDMADLLRLVRAAVKRQPEARNRAKDARKEILRRSGHGELDPTTQYEQTERFALADYLTHPKPDNGPPPTSWIVLAQPLDCSSDPVVVTCSSWRASAERLSRLATQDVDALSVEAFGATKRTTLKARQWASFPAISRGDDEVEPIDGIGGVEIALRRGTDPDHRRTRKTGWISDPTGETAVRRVLVEHAKLTDRQMAVVLLVAAGHSHAEVGDQLKIARSTVSNTLTVARKKVGLAIDQMAF